jgi:hypothetical protein
MERPTTGAMAGEYLGVREGVIPVRPNCGSSEQRIAWLDYDHPAPLRIRYAACMVHRAVEQPRPARSPFSRRAWAGELPVKVLA